MTEWDSLPEDMKTLYVSQTKSAVRLAFGLQKRKLSTLRVAERKLLKRASNANPDEIVELLEAANKLGQQATDVELWMRVLKEND